MTTAHCTIGMDMCAPFGVYVKDTLGTMQQVATHAIEAQAQACLQQLHNDINGTTTDKAFATLQAQFALQGHTLERSFKADNLHPTYWATRWGQVHEFATLAEVRAYLVKIGGAA